MNGFILRNGNFVECPIGRNHSDVASEVFGMSIGETYNNGIIRMGYIGRCVCVDGNTLSYYQLMTLQNRIPVGFNIYIDLNDFGEYEFTYKQFLSFTHISDFHR